MSGPTLEVRVKSVTFEAERINSYELQADRRRRAARVHGGRAHRRAPAARRHAQLFAHQSARRDASLRDRRRARRRERGRLALHPRVGASRASPDDLAAGQQLRARRRRGALGPHRGRHRGHADLLHGAAADSARPRRGSSTTARARARSQRFSSRSKRCAVTGGRSRSTSTSSPAARCSTSTRIVAAAPADAHLYCCGPTRMLEAFERRREARPAERVHVEYFSAKEAPARAGGFTVVLAKSNRTRLRRGRQDHPRDPARRRHGPGALVHGRRVRDVRDARPRRHPGPPRHGPERRRESVEQDHDDLLLGGEDADAGAGPLEPPAIARSVNEGNARSRRETLVSLRGVHRPRAPAEALDIHLQHVDPAAETVRREHDARGRRCRRR